MAPASQAEAYASAHNAHPPQHKRDKGKPLFDWISRKLGGSGKRPTYAQGEVERSKVTGMGSEHSLRSVQRRQREKNNPYPNIPVPRRASTVESSFVSRSDSEMSRRTDDNASTKPIPPSHRSSSAAPSTVLTKSASTSLLSPKGPPPHSASTASLDKSVSTKPTTMSFDSGPHIGHIATAPVSPASRLFPHRNPHPQAVPDDNASTITLASSHRPTRKAAGLVASPSVTWAPEPNDRASEHYPPSGLSMRPRIADTDASVRAIRRRTSWESDRSQWSWRTPEVRDAVAA